MALKAECGAVGALNALQGGKFGHGFVSAGFTEALSPAVGQIPGEGFGPVLARTAVSAAIGGTTSKLAGGSFANGAQTGAFQQLFNSAVHEYWDRVIENASYGFENTANAANEAVDYWQDVGGVTGAVMGTAAMTMTPDYIGNTSATLATLPLGGPAGKGLGIGVNLIRALRTTEAAIAAAANSGLAAKALFGFLNKLPASQRLISFAFDRLGARIASRFSNWNFVKSVQADGSILYSGEFHLMIINKAGQIFRGPTQNFNLGRVITPK